ncbi:histidine phosphotransferase family protein [uncultured Roseovarius sp.]|uniref:histidine phosphotransferase family protein n=1 Tax=uncultured Roseovarius sp. TaxID=293344 RepID=UPI002608D466|nr:histidine phosphotransferase family protein [uncultured Roseovarius sp.]
MSQDDTAIATLVGSRICHDLASPIGAIANGLELLALSSSGRSPELALVEDSLRGARAALDISRLAFGYASGAENVSAEGLNAVLSAYYAGKPRLTLDCRLSGSLARAHARVITLACLGIETVLPRGGGLSISGTPEATTITATSEHLVADTALWEGLQRDAPLPADDPRHVQFHMLRHCLAARGMVLEHRVTANAFTITF